MASDRDVTDIYRDVHFPFTALWTKESSESIIQVYIGKYLS